MFPILFKFGPFKIYSYGVSVALAFMVGTYLITLEAQRKNINPEKILNLSFGLAITGIVGARILYVLQNFQFYWHYPHEILMLNKGGLSFYGGLILAIIFAVVFLRKQQLPILKILDIASPYLALAHAIGRIGCFLNGCCYGKPTGSFFAVYFQGETTARHPVQIYASLALLLLFIILRIYQTKQKPQTYFSGQVFLLYLLLYSIVRFFMEYLRGDSLPVWAHLTLHQLISIGMFVISSLIWWKRCKRYIGCKSFA
jgi:phosphatidylglycerol:prolipoprotein diacylglycerol transferase